MLEERGQIVQIAGSLSVLINIKFLCSSWGKIEFQLYSIQTHKYINNGAQYILPAEHLLNRDSLTKNLDEKMSIYRQMGPKLTIYLTKFNLPSNFKNICARIAHQCKNQTHIWMNVQHTGYLFFVCGPSTLKYNSIRGA